MDCGAEAQATDQRDGNGSLHASKTTVLAEHRRIEQITHRQLERRGRKKMSVALILKRL
jgi:hypothetical protein